MTAGSTYIQGTINGEAIRFMTFQCLTLTAQNTVMSSTFVYPVKLDRGSSIVIPATGATLGATRRAGGVHGFFVENYKG
jgi:hypothetical protein